VFAASSAELSNLVQQVAKSESGRRLLVFGSDSDRVLHFGFFTGLCAVVSFLALIRNFLALNSHFPELCVGNLNLVDLDLRRLPNFEHVVLSHVVCIVGSACCQHRDSFEDGYDEFGVKTCR